MNPFDSLPPAVSLKTTSATELQRIEIELFVRIQKGDSEALNKLVMQNMREAVLYTRSVAKNLDEGALISLCYDALVRNAKRFDPARQRFFAFAKAGLRGAIYRSYNKEAKHRPSTEEPPKPFTFGKREVLTEEYDHEHRAEPILESQVVEPDFRGIFTRDLWDKVKPLVEQRCNDQERMVLTLTYVSGLNFQESARLLGVSKNAIQRTHSRAIEKLQGEVRRQRELFYE